MSHKKTSGTAVSIPLGVLCGTIISLMTTCSFAALLSWLTLNGKVGHQTLGYFILGILLSTSMIGSLLAATITKRRWMLVCLVTGIVHILSLLGINALFFGGNYKGSAASAFVICAGSLIIGTFGIIHKRYQEYSYEKYRTR